MRQKLWNSISDDSLISSLCLLKTQFIISFIIKKKLWSYEKRDRRGKRINLFKKIHCLWMEVEELGWRQNVIWSLLVNLFFSLGCYMYDHFRHSTRVRSIKTRFVLFIHKNELKINSWRGVWRSLTTSVDDFLFLHFSETKNLKQEVEMYH